MVDIIPGGSICNPGAAPNAGVTIGYLNTISDLRAVTSIFTSPVTVYVAGNQLANDGFGGMFTFDPTATAADNGNSVIAQTNTPGAGRWIINAAAAPANSTPVPRNIVDIQGDSLNPFQFGAIADGESHALSTVTEFGGLPTAGWMLSQWQAVLPSAVALTDELDWCAWQSMMDVAAANDLPIMVSKGTFIVNRSITRRAGTSLYLSGQTTLRAIASMPVMISSSLTVLEYGSIVVGGVLDCNYLAVNGIELNCASGCLVQDILVNNSIGYAFKLGDAGASLPCVLNHFVRCRSRWVSPTIAIFGASAGFYALNAQNNFISDCVFSDHNNGIYLQSSFDNRFTGIRVFNDNSLSEMQNGYLIDSGSGFNHWNDCTAAECVASGWNIAGSFQTLVACAITKTYGTANALIGILDSVGLNSFSGITITGIGVAIQQDIGFASGAVKSSDYLGSFINENVNVQIVGTTNSPPSQIVTFAQNTVPAGFLLCNGAAVSRTIYVGLFWQIGTNFGAGDGSTTFNLPDITATPYGAGMINCIRY